MADKGLRGFARMLAATRYSLMGLRACWRSEASFRFEVLLCIPLLPAAFWLGDGAVEKVLLAGSCVLVLIVEVLNSSIEAIVDRIGKEYHSLSGQAKDQGSAAVFLSILLWSMTWALLLIF